MVVGLGIDIVEVARMAALLERHPERAPQRLFAPEERADCAGRASSAECLAVRFAAKEAFLKALGTGLRDGVGWREIVVRQDGRGRPDLVLDGGAAEQLRMGGGRRVHVTLSHEAG
ncbi:MAG: holo-ACP synthase, partial [Gemmatimonadota bacterium]